ncbi:MAG TPA: hemerythrin domain-containing protein [Polyangiaceae bacterium]|nr:hemerythrin domain-containing protein [Polyangiaceae bacterium]
MEIAPLVVEMTETPFEVREPLLADHERLESLFQQVISAFEAGSREDVDAIWSRFDRELLEHMEAEERCLVPWLFRADQRAARSIIQEHRLIQSRLVELGESVDLHTIRLDVARTFIDELRAHAKHEDRVLYSWADEHVPEEDRRSLLGSLIERAKLWLAAIAP